MIKISKKFDLNSLKKRIKILRNTSKTLLKLSKASAPKNLTSEQQKGLRDYNQWLERSSKKLDNLANTGDSIIQNAASSGNSQEELMQLTKEMQQMNQAFNSQYLKLQQEMQKENRQFAMISNIMKVKHDTAKSAINNVR